MAEGLARIESVWAWVCTDKTDGTEGVPAFRLPNGMAMPMYSTRKDIAMKMKDAATDLAGQGHKMAFVEFTARITHDEIEPS